MIRSIYLIRGNNGKYKIGIAKNPQSRLKQLQTGNPEPLSIIETYKTINASKIEKALHNRYSYARKEGEWFELSISNELTFINECEEIDDNINLLRKLGNPFI